jgi:hypothetical protein
MKLRAARIVVGFLSLSLVVFAQTPSSTTPAASASAQVPRLIRFSGIAKDATGKPLTGVLGVTFSLYKDQQAGTPLWMETQNVQPDSSGHYTVLLGSTKSTGVPPEMFASGEAQWLGVRPQGEAEQARVLMVSVPYALKALDAETVGGKPASAFALATQAGTPAVINPAQPTEARNTSGGASPTISGSGQPGYIPEWLSTTKLGDSALFQNSAGNLGISTITPAQKFEVDLGNILVKGPNNFKSGGDTAFLYVGDTNHHIEAIFSNTGTHSGGLTLGTYKNPRLIYLQDVTGNVGIGVGTRPPAAKLDVNGTVNAATSFNLEGLPFAFSGLSQGNAFLGYAGNFTMTGDDDTAIGNSALSSGTTGGGNMASGSYSLFHNTTGGANTATGAYTLYLNTTGNENTVSGYEAMSANTSGKNNVAIGFSALFNNTANNNVAIGSSTLLANTTGADNTAVGLQALFANTTGGDNTAVGLYALFANTTATYDTASGADALYSNTTGDYNTASGYQALYSNNTGGENTAVGVNALYSNNTGNDLTCIGYDCTADADGLRNASAIGAHAVVGESNALVLGGIGPYAVKVGIGTATPSNVLTIAQGAGHPVSDGWETFSSRRWKTNIQTLQGALWKVEQLRGVSYDLKANGKHEVGVIAEEVGAVVPEVVTWDKDGKDAQSVDYSRLTALLIEATKEQQRQIQQEQAANNEQRREIQQGQAQLAKALRQIKQQQNVLRAQAAAMQSLKAEVRETRETLLKVKTQVTTAQPTLVAAK